MLRRNMPTLIVFLVAYFGLVALLAVYGGIRWHKVAMGRTGK